jgi:hypothetical protein
MSGTGDLRMRGKSFALINALNTEWERLSDDSSLIVSRWAAAHAALVGCSTLADVLATLDINSDAALAALLAEHARGCGLAGRTVLQSLLGKIVLLTLRDASADVGDYVAAVWCRICTYPLENRPIKIAANLTLDALKSVKGEQRWGRRDVDVTTCPSGFRLDELQDEAFLRLSADHNSHVNALSATQVVAAANQLGLIDVPTRAVLLSVYSDGLTGMEAADRHDTTVDMVRFRCSKGVRRMAKHAALLAEAA